MKILKHLAIALVGVLAAASAHAQAMGIVLDVKGVVRAELSGRSELLDITAPLKAGMRIQIEKGSELAFVFYPAHTQYSAVGPATLQVTDKSVTQLQGVAMKTKPLPENRSLAALGFQNQVVPAAMVMKTGFNTQGRPKLLEPQDGETLLTQRPEFVWESETVAPTDFTLRLDGQMVHQQRVEASTRLVMPEALVLQADKKYEWEVVRAQPGATTRRATFTVASVALRNQVLQSQPAAQAEVADWLLHAMVLAQANMRSESARVLLQVAGQRPASAALQSVAP